MNDRSALLPTVPALTTASQPADPMSVIATYADAWLRGDHGAALACYHEDFTLHYYGRNALSGDHAGKARAIATLRELARRTRWQVLEIRTMLSGKDAAALVARMNYHRDGICVERDRVLVFAVSDGWLRECWAYDQDQPLMDELIGME
jgi:ketosteroid isomerase-like protein